jgi:hypothetical protein
LLATSTHALAQATKGELHAVVHLPALHTIGGAHRMPQPPQLAGSLCVLTHAPLQSLKPLGQAH